MGGTSFAPSEMVRARGATRGGRVPSSRIVAAQTRACRVPTSAAARPMSRTSFGATVKALTHAHSRVGVPLGNGRINRGRRVLFVFTGTCIAAKNMRWFATFLMYAGVSQNHIQYPNTNTQLPTN